jgi:hypothetical protein
LRLWMWWSLLLQEQQCSWHHVVLFKYKYSKTCHKQNLDVAETCLQRITFTVPSILCKNRYETTFSECNITQKKEAKTRLQQNILHVRI